MFDCFFYGKNNFNKFMTGDNFLTACTGANILKL